MGCLFRYETTYYNVVFYRPTHVFHMAGYGQGRGVALEAVQGDDLLFSSPNGNDDVSPPSCPSDQ